MYVRRLLAAECGPGVRMCERQSTLCCVVVDAGRIVVEVEAEGTAVVAVVAAVGMAVAAVAAMQAATRV